ncbi:NAD(P)-dependent oxidoreductase [Halocola ammonii]
MVKLGIIREGKTPPDKRVPLSPKQCVEVLEKFDNVELVVQPSNIRKYRDEEYQELGLTLQEDLSDCDILLGVKEVPIEMLIPNKTYLFFSHTYKMQPYNAKLLRAILDKKIRLVDYEMIKDKSGKRLIGFGRYAGVVGCYNGLRAFGKKHKIYDLKPAHECEDRKEMEGQLSKVELPKSTKFVLTGFGRVGHGAREILDLISIKEVESKDFLEKEFDQPVFTHLEVNEYNERIADGGFDKKEFYKDPAGYRSTFPRYCHQADMYIPCHYWAEGAPFLFTRQDAKHPDWKVSVVADISCDIDGPVASTLRPSTVADPFYGYDRYEEKETDFMAENAIGVMAVDNLPCELPKDASEDFGKELIKHVLPPLLGEDPDRIIGRASETNLEGELTDEFAYLEPYVASAEKV